MATNVDGEAEVSFGTAKVKVSAEQWVGALTTARDRFGLNYFSWLSAVDWAEEVAVGDPPTSNTDFRIELIACLGDIGAGRNVLFCVDLDQQQPQIDSLVPEFPGANWHEREAAEMFGIDFTGHPDLTPLYLPEAFEGNPLRKTFPLRTREIKPWPGLVDVEPIPEPPAEAEAAS